jgi:two-component system, sensor histidine kinase YesM
MKKIMFIISKINNMKMKQKLIVSYLLVVLLPVLLVGIILTKGMSDMALEQATNNTVDRVDQIAGKMSEVFKLGSDISRKIFLSSNLMYVLKNRYNSSLEVYLDYQNNMLLDDEIALHPDVIRDIRLYSMNDTLLNNSRFIPVDKEMYDYQWFSQAFNDNGKISWNYNLNEIKNKYFLSLTRLLKDTNGNPLGILVIEINDKYFDSLLSGMEFDVSIIDSRERIIASKDKALVGDKLSILQIGKYKNMDRIVFKEKPSIIIDRSFSPENGENSFKIVSIFPINTIMSKVWDTFFLGFFIMAGSLLLSLLLIIFFSDALSKRINQLSRDIHDVASGNFNVCLNIDGDDEIGQLSADLQHMIKSIRDLIYEVYEVNLQKKQLVIQQKEIKLRMLANQTNPHFLFNVLETVRSKANCIGAMEIVEIVKLLGKILRKNLEFESESITLREELDLVKCYLDLQKYRFNDKIDYEINNYLDIDDYKVLPMIIQPIVENSVIHGLETKLGPGKICIDLRKEEDILKVTVADNGIGMDDSRLKKIRRSLEEQEYDPNRRVGLRNVYQRIKLRYGEQYGLEISSEINKGTKISILIPERGDSNVENSDCG